MTAPTNRVDQAQEGANMFGVVPCPKCGSLFRVTELAETPASERAYLASSRVIVCDDCGYQERAAP